MPSPYAGNPFAQKFGYFQAAVNDPELRAQAGGIQAYVWARLRQDYLSAGNPLPAGAFAAVNQLLSLAGEQRRASLNLAESRALAERSGLDQAIVANMTAPHLDTRALQDQVLGPQHRVVYQTQEVIEGEPVLSFRTHDFGYDLPQSISALNDAVEAAAQVSAADYGYEWAGLAEPVALTSY